MVELRWLIKRVKSDSRRPLREIGNEIHVVGGFRNTKRLQGPQQGDKVKRIKTFNGDFWEENSIHFCNLVLGWLLIGIRIIIVTLNSQLDLRELWVSSA